MTVKGILIVCAIVAFSFWAVGRAVDHEMTGGGDAYATTGIAHNRTSGVDVNGRGELYQGKTARWWARRAVQARKDANTRARTIRRLQHAQARESSHFFDWLAGADCVHRHERGADGWKTKTGNGYYGGMQADLGFQRTYAADMLRRYDTTADGWPWYRQMQMAYRGWLFRGWDPWPNTARECGLR